MVCFSPETLMVGLVAVLVGLVAVLVGVAWRCWYCAVILS